MTPRRIAAIVLPKLACEIAKSRAEVKGPLAIIIDPTFARPPSDGPSRPQATLPGFEEEQRPQSLFSKESAVIGAVCEEARRYGVRPGQRVAEATALVARLTVLTVSFAEIDRALGRVAEVAMAFGTTASIQLSVAPGSSSRIAPGAASRAASGSSPRESPRPYGSARAAQQVIADRSPHGDGPFDTVWVDITGAAHLRGGEDALLDALGERVSALGHNVHLAIADGPRIAQALARWGVSDKGHLIAGEGRSVDAMASLPVRALPLPPDRIAFLLRVGVLTVGDLVRLPKAEALSRLGPRGAEALAVAAGFDPAPLVPFTLPPVLEEETSFDDGVQSIEPVLFVLRGATSRLSARLEARGEACTRLDIELPYDASIARRVLAERGLVTPGRRPLLRPTAPLRPRFRRPAIVPVRALPRRSAGPALLRVRSLPRAAHPPGADDPPRPCHGRPHRHLRDRPRPPRPARFRARHPRRSEQPARAPRGALGRHRPRARRRARHVRRDPPGGAHPPRPRERRRRGGPPSAGASAPLEKSQICPARLLRTPVSLGRAGSSVVAVTGQLYVIERRRFIGRLDDVEWWTDKPCSRDYFRTTLSSGAAYASARPGAEAGAGLPRPQGRNVTADALIFIDPRTEEAFLQGWFE